MCGSSMALGLLALSLSLSLGFLTLTQVSAPACFIYGWLQYYVWAAQFSSPQSKASNISWQQCFLLWWFGFVILHGLGLFLKAARMPIAAAHALAKSHQRARVTLLLETRIRHQYLQQLCQKTDLDEMCLDQDTFQTHRLNLTRRCWEMMGYQLQNMEKWRRRVIIAMAAILVESR